MSRSEILAAALALEPNERVALSVELLESVEAVEDDVEGAWGIEIDRRGEELERGEVETVAAEDVFARFGRVF